MKHIKLFESYKSHKELEVLANDLILYWGDIYYKEIQKYIKLKEERGEDSSDPFTNWAIKSIYFYKFKDDYADMSKYEVLRDYIRTSKTYIHFGKKNSATKGSQHKTHLGQEINIYLNESFLRDLDYRLKDGRLENGRDIYVPAYYEFYSTLLHELQHAYDRHRSLGKAFKYPKGYIEDYENKKEIVAKSEYTPLSDEEIDFINKQNRIYRNLKHEVDARYTQAVNKVRAIKMDWNKDYSDVREYYLEDWKEFYDHFKLEFDGWKELSDKDKKSLTRRISQFYEFERDEVKRKNKELREERKKKK